jgi:hypothetical protein
MRLKGSVERTLEASVAGTLKGRATGTRLLLSIA